MDEKRLFAVKEEMEKPMRVACSPLTSSSFFTRPFQQLAASWFASSEPGRYEITNVHHIRERDRQITGHATDRNADPCCAAYERVCFEKQLSAC